MDASENRIDDAGQSDTDNQKSDTSDKDDLEKNTDDLQETVCENSDGQNDAGGDAVAAETEPTDAQKIEQLEAKVAELNDQYLRKAADFENYRKRMFKEKQDAIDFANQGLLVDLIAVLDDFERAIKAAAASAKTENDFTAFYDGVSMIEKRLVGDLESKWGLKRFESVGTPFDPNRHEAMMMEKSADANEAVVAEEFAKGYILKERVIRSAKVKVLMPE
ncbi:protein GrpE [Spirochaetia bacterium]|nr:protein GrpE [Spirochaetia bacterium]